MSAAAAAGTAAAIGAPARWACYDRPAIQNEFVREEREGTRRASLLLSGVRCGACVWQIDRAISAVPGVRDIAVDPATARAELAWDPATVRLSTLLGALADLGYVPAPCVPDAAEQAARDERRAAQKRLVVAGLGMMQVGSYALAMYLGAVQAMEPAIQDFLRNVSLVVATPVVFYAGAPFFLGLLRSLRQRRLGMDVPVALAIGAAWGASVFNTFRGSGEVYFDSATMFVFFLGIARYLEMAGRHRTLSLTAALAEHLPRVAQRLRPDGMAETVAVAELVPGETVLVQPGGTVPVDGTLCGAEGELDEALLTGESTPVRRRTGECVLAGSLNLRRAIRLRVVAVGSATTLGQMSRLMAAARSERPRLARLADRIARHFIARLLVVTAGVGAWWLYAAPERAFEIVLSVLVVTCPCALAIATPAAYTVAMSALARRGVLVRRPGAIEALARADCVVFDKTGTLTTPRARLAAVLAPERFAADAALELAARLEAASEHPLARAFPAPSGPPATDVSAVPGQGLEGDLDGVRYRIGRRDYVLALSPDPDPDPDPDAGRDAEEGDIWLGDGRGPIARFGIAESARAGAHATVAALSAAGLRTVVASGDHEGAVAAMARFLGANEWRARLAPEEKLWLLRDLQRRGEVVVMVGDGINDSPVLAGADVSVAMGGGTSVARHAADGVLLAESLEPLVDAVRLSRRTMRVVKQNFGWAIGWNVIAVPLAAMGLIQPWMAAVGMSVSSLIVTLNALRVARLPGERAGGAASGDSPVTAAVPPGPPGAVLP